MNVRLNEPERADAALPETIEPVSAAAAQHARARLDEAALAARRHRSRRATFIKWLRKVHGWVGLWGAVLGLLFGVTGFLLNHRAGPMKIPTGEPQVEQMQVALPAERPASPQQMMRWLQRELRFDGRPGRVRREAAHPVAWGERSVVQPEFWQMSLAGPAQSLQAEYWVGNGYVSVKRMESSFLGTLNNLHRGVGLGVGWVLLIDTIAGSLILLSLTGVLLWTELNRRRTIGVVLVLGSIGAALVAGLA
ncbi:hypothetical protein C7408_103373 [Paraburkholderia caballeronis]|nr:hypothetical protein C7408_103373 [Paraburkholderia caballeronis]TDV19847.1 hypothetical protein C7406_10368 [Paraburkholderia caballeronis]TDV28064.1 hypothetical protein C7404_10368 [Paraburkholderia caballeronis]TDV37246.1 hypothetical protein C7405_103374 [Paraburkholderia caballeronis]